MSAAAPTTEPRHGDWLQTATGKQFFPLDPRPEEIDIFDIAWALGNLCRYGGHSRDFYSVAEHCVLMSRAVSPENAAWALMHDASEAYLVDVPRPIKPALAGYREAEDRLMRAICTRFALPPVMPDEVKTADHQILTDELWQAMAPPPVPWSTAGTPLGVVLQFWTPSRAKIEFILRAKQLQLIPN